MAIGSSNKPQQLAIQVGPIHIGELGPGPIHIGELGPGPIHIGELGPIRPVAGSNPSLA